jgi:indolepyruvate decarboxylase
VKEVEVDDQVLEECMEETLKMVEAAQKPIIIADMELIRKKLHKQFRHLLEKSGFPYVTVMMGKAVIDEDHPQFIGLYEGNRSRAYVKDRVESSDCIIYLGALMTDFNTGGFSADLKPKKLITATNDKVNIKYHSFDKIPLETFMAQLSDKVTKRDPATLDIKRAIYGCVHKPARYIEQGEAPTKHAMQKGEKTTLRRFFDRVSDFIQPNSVVIAETGVSMFSVAETLLPKGCDFIGQIFYGSIGYTVGATLGVAMALKDTDREVVLFVGDGSFQVTAQDLSTYIRNKLKPVIFLINNDGYTIERAITDRHPLYNNIQPWAYSLLPYVFAGGKDEATKGAEVFTEDQLDDVLENFVPKNRKEGRMSFVEVHFDRMDIPASLAAAGESMAKKNQIAK